MKKKVEDAVEAVAEELINTKGLSVEQILDGVCEALHTLADTLESQGIDSELITGALFRCFAERMADVNDRETYEEVLEEALETPWEDITLH